LESYTIEGDSPVTENPKCPSEFLSSTVPVKLRVNPGRPLPKTKYSMSTDSELVPRGKGEKSPC